MTELFSGVGVALLTMFDESGDLDPGATAALAADLVQRGMRAVLVMGLRRCDPREPGVLLRL